MPIVERHPDNRPDLVFRVDATDRHLLRRCKSWYAIKKPRSLTFYIEEYTATRQPRVSLHRLITGAPEGMTVNHLDGDGLNNTRSNLRVVPQSETAAYARNVLKRGKFNPPGAAVENKVRKILADGTIRIYVYNRRTRRLLRSWNENSLRTNSANALQTGSARAKVAKGEANAQ